MSQFLIVDNRKMSLKVLLEKYAALIVFALCIFCSSFSFMRQVSISPGNILYLSALAVATSLAIAFYFNFRYRTKTLYCAIMFFVLSVSLLCWLYGLHRTELKAVYVFATFAVFAVLLTAYLIISKKMTAGHMILLVFAFGFMLRFTYVLVTPIGVRQHDFYGFTEDGHGGYIKYLYENNFKLPSTDPRDTDQFYHPPFHYFICALWWKLQSLIGIENSYAQENIQTLTLFYSSVCMILTYKIMKRFNLSGLPLVVGVAIMAFHPTFIIFSGSVNNDILSVTFMLAAMNGAMKWYKSDKPGDIILTAVYIGLGMMTKLSAYMICIPVAVIFALRFFAVKKGDGFKNSVKRYSAQFGVFLAVCAPLALFWSIRNAVLFGMPASYVQKLGEDSWQYVGNYTFIQRILLLKPIDVHSYSVYDQWVNRGARLYNEFNPLVSLLKTAMFGEYINNYDYGALTGFGDLLFWSGAILALLSFGCAVHVVIRAVVSKENLPLKITLAVAYASMLLFYYIFCFTYPHHCTMNVRYVSPLILFGATFIALDLKEINVSLDEKRSKIITRSVASVTATFSLFSTVMIMIIASYTL